MKGFPMKLARIVPLLPAALLAACSGGGGNGAPVAPIIGATAQPIAQTATFPLSIAVPNKAVTSAARTPQYVSPGTASVAVYDGTTLIYVGNYTAGSNPQFTTVFATTSTTTVTGGSCTRRAARRRRARSP